ncbi:MAG: amidohydrolase family protein [Candidatus Binatia bacterium]|nr:amidohydrolase family protein [Candidatus Binatia bacterium]
MTDLATLATPLRRDLPMPIDRVVHREGLQLPPGTVVVSADSHWEIAEDIFVERLPAKFRDMAPRIWTDNVVQFGFSDGKGNVIDPMTSEMKKIWERSTEVEGIHDLNLRIRDMDAEGIAKEINFPSFGLGFSALPDLELREAIFRVYDEALAEMQATAAGRSYGVAVISNWWDATQARSAVQHIVDLGFKAMILPVRAGLHADGKPVVYSEPELDPLWEAIEASGLPLCFHIGEGARFSGRGGWGIAAMTSFSPFVPVLAQLIFGGILERFPKLKIVFAEGGIGWVPAALQDAELVFDSFTGLHNYFPKLRPTEYWSRNCHATFQNDALGLRLLDHIGVDNVMWAVDYPHAEGSWGMSEASMRTVLDSVPPDAARKILGGNALRVFNL